MRKLCLALGFALLATTAAQAAPLTGTLEIGGGSNTVNITGTTPLTGNIGFFPGSAVLGAVQGTSGSFLAFVGDAVNFTGQGNPPTQIPFTDLTAAGHQPFLSIASGPSFTLTSATETETPIGGGNFVFTISGAGTFAAFDGFTATPASFTYSTQSIGGVFQDTSFSASAQAVPGPIVGAGLPGLVTMLSGAGLWWRRRKKLQSAA